MEKKRDIVAERNEQKKAFRDQDNRLREAGVSHAQLFQQNSLFAGSNLSAAFKDGRFKF